MTPPVQTTAPARTTAAVQTTAPARTTAAVASPEDGITALRRVRTVTRLHRAGLSAPTLATILPSWYASVAELAESSDLPIVLALGDA